MLRSRAVSLPPSLFAPARFRWSCRTACGEGQSAANLPWEVEAHAVSWRPTIFSSYTRMLAGFCIPSVQRKNTERLTEIRMKIPMSAVSWIIMRGLVLSHDPFSRLGAISLYTKILFRAALRGFGVQSLYKKSTAVFQINVFQVSILPRTPMDNHTHHQLHLEYALNMNYKFQRVHSAI